VSRKFLHGLTTARHFQQRFQKKKKFQLRGTNSVCAHFSYCAAVHPRSLEGTLETQAVESLAMANMGGFATACKYCHKNFVDMRFSFSGTTV
jgi:isopentenyldiphosphate isomerase